jgi:hypothetical protein
MKRKGGSHRSLCGALVTGVALAIAGGWLDGAGASAYQNALACESSEMVGAWHGFKYGGIDFAFVFNRDGTYSYRAGRGNFEWTSSHTERLPSSGRESARDGPV